MQLMPVTSSSLNASFALPLQIKQTHIKAEANPGPQQQNHVKFPRCLVSPLMASLVALSPLCIPEVSFGQVMDTQRGAALFRKACIGCHDGGGNIIQPMGALLTVGSTIRLRRNGVEKEEEIYRVTYYGNGRMPGFGEDCTPRGQCTFGPRLQDEEIKLLAEFVKLQADRGWPNIESYGE
ncbi:hypothetical protein Sjap_003758 [Stephania japonica]|uniref:Cytochrome c-553 n=1 Tax=Stephania japonica TaxID=461633 RepID=A0AAP0PTW9_9MAGN